MTKHNVTLELDLRTLDDDTADHILDQFTPYDPALGTSLMSRIEVVLTIEASTVLEALANVPLLLQDTDNLPPIIGVDVTTTESYDARAEVLAAQHLLSVVEAASEIGISQQAASRAIARGDLHATRIGNAYGVPMSAALAYRRRREQRIAR